MLVTSAVAIIGAAIISITIVLIVRFDFFRIKSTGILVEVNLEEVENLSEYEVVRTGWRHLSTFEEAKRYKKRLANVEEERRRFFDSGFERKIETGATAPLLIRGTKKITALPFMGFTDTISYSPFMIVEMNSRMYIFEVIEERLMLRGEIRGEGCQVD